MAKASILGNGCHDPQDFGLVGRGVVAGGRGGRETLLYVIMYRKYVRK